MNNAYGIQGQTAPELRVSHWIDPHGQTSSAFKLAAHAGQVRILYCFQSWCPGCHSSGFPTLQALITHYRNTTDAPVLAAIQTAFEGHHANGSDQLQIMQLRYQLPLPFGHDDARPQPHTMIDYRTGGTPWWILIDRQGKVVFNDFHLPLAATIRGIDIMLANDAAQ